MIEIHISDSRHWEENAWFVTTLYIVWRLALFLNPNQEGPFRADGRPGKKRG
jgi:hypothetical protein